MLVLALFAVLFRACLKSFEWSANPRAQLSLTNGQCLELYLAFDAKRRAFTRRMVSLRTGYYNPTCFSVLRNITGSPKVP